MSKLFINDDSDSEEKLNINTDYATNYDNWRQKEELHKLKARYGEDAETLMKSDEESSDSSEDDEGEEIPEEFEKNFYKTLACLKNKDPRIYNEEVKFFDETDIRNIDNQKKEKKEKSLFLRDYERKIIVERGGKYSDSEDEGNEKETMPKNPTYIQEQHELKESFKKALQDESNSQEDELLFKPKTKSTEEKQREEDDYKEWLKGQRKDINKDEAKELKPLRDFWTNPELDASEKFLRDYVLNKKFLDKDSKDTDLDYEHVAHDSDENLSEDERNIDTQEEFEHKYNFRFEEPDQEFIKRYPRTLENSLRKKDTKRAQKRAEVKARKEDEKLKKREELKELKAMKRKEIEEKIEKLKEITGNDDLNLEMMDLDADFDPDEYDKKMGKLFNDDYYTGQEEDVKPEFPDIDEELRVESTWDDYEPGADEIAQEEIPYHDAHCEDPEFNMDADYNGQSLQEELVESTKKKKKRRRSKFSDLISKEKPKFDPNLHTSYKEYYDQYYALDYEDMIGDLPCRFKYRQVVPNDFGLSVEEILMADDRELNKWCSLKKALEHKPEYKELNEVKLYKQKAANEALKKKILKSLYSTQEEEEQSADPLPGTSGTGPNSATEGTKKNRKRKRKNKQNTEANAEQNTEEVVKDIEGEQPIAKKSKKSKKETDVSSEKKESSMEINLPEQQNNESSGGKKMKLDESKEDKQTVVSEAKKRKKNAQSGIKTHESKQTRAIKTDELSKSKNKLEDSIKLEETKDVKISDGNKISKNNKANNKAKSNKQPENGVLSKKQQRRLLFLEKNKKKNKNSKNNKGQSQESNDIASLSAERLKAYGLNPKKFKNKLKYMKKD